MLNRKSQNIHQLTLSLIQMHFNDSAVDKFESNAKNGDNVLDIFPHNANPTILSAKEGKPRLPFLACLFFNGLL